MLPAVAIVVPASLLAVLGWRAYRADALSLRDRFRQDQAAMVRLAAARLSEEVGRALEDLAERARARAKPGARSVFDEQSEARFRATHSLARHVFVVHQGQLIYPAPTQRFASRDERSTESDALQPSSAVTHRYIQQQRRLRRMRAVFGRALRAEYRGRLGRAARLYGIVARAVGGGRMAANGSLGLARVLRRRGDLKGARKALVSVAQAAGAKRNARGIAYKLLAHAGLVELGDRARLLEMHKRLMGAGYATSPQSRRFYLRWVVRRLRRALGRSRLTAASSTTPPVKVSAPLLSSSQLRGISQRTEALFATERFGRMLARYGVQERALPSGERTGALLVDAGTILVLRRDGQTMVGFSLDQQALRRRVGQQQRRLPPSGRGIALRLSRVGQRIDVPAKKLLHNAALPAPLGHFSLIATRAAADPVADIERKGQLRHIGMVLGLVLVLAAGLFFTYRGVRRESDLAQLKSDFASNVSHELKTPLTSIRMYAEMLQQGIAEGPDDQQRYHEVIIRESERLGRLIANVLDFSRVERGTRRYDLVEIEVDELVRDALDTFSRLADEDVADVTLADKIEPGASKHVIADHEAAVQSLLNLLSNAVKYSRGAPGVEVTLRGGHGELGVEVRDHGIGIPPAEQKRIFDDFYRAPQARQANVEGTGLGLALVRRHMEACGGRVTVQSAVAKGSRFTLWFPAARDEEE
ncbi:MAG: HAMP domain-containing histidine kinase [Myxococcales bacterium]|nr:HAMP domain-containing histidine kinase [Myxococcales bacterium]